MNRFFALGILGGCLLGVIGTGAVFFARDDFFSYQKQGQERNADMSSDAPLLTLLIESNARDIVRFAKLQETAKTSSEKTFWEQESARSIQERDTLVGWYTTWFQEQPTPSPIVVTEDISSSAAIHEQYYALGIMYAAYRSLAHEELRVYITSSQGARKERILRMENFSSR